MKKIFALSISLLLVFSSIGMAVTPAEVKNFGQAKDDPMVNVIVQLDGDPVLAYETQLKEQGNFNLKSINSYSQKLDNQRESVINTASRKGINLTTTHSYTHSFTGFSGTMPLSQVNELLKIDGVKAVFPDMVYELPDLDYTYGVPATNAPYLWNLPEAITGQGMTVAVLDTGIDYTHPDLGGGFGKGHQVKGGHNYTNDGLPNDPMDIEGHGTHVAGTVAANGEILGVAPDADLYALKVLGDDGSGQSSWIIAGIEWAVNPPNGLPRADVINMSLGNTLTSPNFPTSLAANQAADAGVIVVSSSGNSGHNVPSVGSPSTADKVISVASYGFQYPPVMKFDNGVTIDRNINPAQDAPKPDGADYEIVYAGLARQQDFNDIDVQGKIVLARRGEIAFAEKGMHAKNNGAVGIIVFNTTEAPFGMAGSFEIPAFAIPLSTGIDILEMMDENPNLKVSLDLLEGRDMMAGSSSGGPTSAYTLKPDITAPGAAIYSTYPVADGSYATLGGTSMASPHVAGGTALLKQYRPDLSVEEIKALLMNTPWWLNDMYDEKYPVTTQGAGVMDLMAASKSRGIALPGSLSLNVSGENNDITIKNTSDEDITYSVEFVSDSLTAIHAEEITVKANSEAQLEITFDLNVKEGPHEGYVILTPTEALETLTDDDGKEYDYYDKLQVTVYYHEGDIESYFAKDLKFNDKFSTQDKIDITFTLTQDTEWVAVVVMDMEANIVSIPAEAPYGLPAGTWTMYNTDLGVPDGEYILRLFVMNTDGDVHELWEPFEVNSEKANIVLDIDSFISEDLYTIKGQLDREATVTVNGELATPIKDNGFKLQVELEDGENTFDVVAKTPFGVTSKKTVVIEKVDGDQIFELGSLTGDTIYTSSETIFVYDNLTPGSVVKISVNGGSEIKAVADENGLVKLTLPLDKGENDIKIVKNYDNKIYTYNASVYRRAVERLAGSNRYETATKISQKGWQNADTVILARGDDFADSLAGVPLSNKLDAPILLTATDKMSQSTLDEITRLGAKNVIILGGNGAISNDVEAQLLEEGLIVDRIGGKNRNETAILIAKEVVGDADTVDTIVVAHGRNFPDGLSAAPLAANLNAPVILVDTNSIDTVTQEFIEEYGVQNTLVIGGSKAISESVKDSLPNPERIAGADRYATSVEIAKHTDCDIIFVASGESFADALALAALAAKLNGNLLLVSPNSIPTVTQSYLEEIKDDINHYYIAGGSVAIGIAVEDSLNSLLK